MRCVWLPIGGTRRTSHQMARGAPSHAKMGASPPSQSKPRPHNSAEKWNGRVLICGSNIPKNDSMDPPLTLVKWVCVCCGNPLPRITFRSPSPFRSHTRNHSCNQSISLNLSSSHSRLWGALYNLSTVNTPAAAVRGEGGKGTVRCACVALPENLFP